MNRIELKLGNNLQESGPPKCGGVLKRSRATTSQESLRPIIGLKPHANFDALPIELKDHIFKFLELNGKKKCRGVCRNWKTIVDQQIAFHLVLTDATFDVVKKFDNDQRIEELIVQDCGRRILPLSFSRSRFSKNISHIHFKTGEGTMTEPIITERPSYFEIISGDWIPGIGTFEGNILALLRLNPDIQSLTIGSMAFEKVKNPTPFSRIRLECLTRLELSFGDDIDDYLINDQSPILPYQKLLKNNFPKLATFSYTCKAYFKPFQLLLDVYTFTARHKLTLRNLHVDSYETYLFPDPGLNSRYSTEDYQTLHSDLCSLQLKELYLRVISFIPESYGRWKLLELDFLSSQVRLEKLELYWIEDVHPTLDFLVNCKDNLVELTIVSNLMDFEMHTNWHLAQKFDCSLIKDCKRLKKLEVDFAEWDLFQECSRARVLNLHLLPNSLRDVSFGGYVPWPETATLSKNLTNLKMYTAHGCGDCTDNVRIVFDFLKVNSSVTCINILHDSCMLVYNFALTLRRRGVSAVLLDSEGVTIHVNRSVFDPTSVQLIEMIEEIVVDVPELFNL